MKHILRMFAVVGIVLLTALMAAGSCDKKNGGNKDNGVAGTATINVTDVKTTVAKLSDGTNIKLKASAFPASVSIAGSDAGLKLIMETPADIAEAFSLEVDGATGGLVVLVDSSITSADKLSVTADGFQGQDTSKKGAFADGSAGSPADGSSALTKKGMKIYSALVDKATYFPESNSTQPVIGCVANATDVPQFEAPNSNSDATGIGDLTAENSKTTVKEVDLAKELLKSTLKGGHKAVCYVASIGVSLRARAGDWLTNSTKKSIEVYAIGVKTDGLKLSEIINGTDDAKDLAILAGGFTAAEMKEILKNSKLAVGAKKLTISVVSDSDFAK